MTCTVNASSKKPGEEGQREHEWKRQRHRAVENNHRHDINVRVVHPLERRDEELRDLRDEHEDEEDNERRSFASRHHKHILEMRQIDRGREPRLAIQFTDAENSAPCRRAARRENSADSGGVNLLARLADRLVSKENSGRAAASTEPVDALAREQCPARASLPPRQRPGNFHPRPEERPRYFAHRRGFADQSFVSHDRHVRLRSGPLSRD